jgi:hypothetical protein
LELRLTGRGCKRARQRTASNVKEHSG